MDDPHQPDMFGHTPVQGALFEEPRPPPPPKKLTADDIREEMLELLAEARAAKTMPWDASDLRSHTAMFPYMAEWLKGGEGDRLLAEFKAEMDRLEAPVEQVAPNWRVLWGLGPYELEAADDNAESASR